MKLNVLLRLLVFWSLENLQNRAVEWHKIAKNLDKIVQFEDFKLLTVVTANFLLENSPREQSCHRTNHSPRCIGKPFEEKNGTKV